MAAGELVNGGRIGGRSRRSAGWMWAGVGASVVFVAAAVVLLFTRNPEPLANGTFRGEDWAGRNLRGAWIRDSDLRSVNFRSADLSHACLNRSSLIGADLSGAKLSGARLQQTVYDDTTRWPVGFDPKAAGAIRLGPGADLHGMFLRVGGREYCELRGLDLRGANLAGTTLVNADLRGADLSGADLRNADLSSDILLNGDLVTQHAPIAAIRQTAARLAGAQFDAATRWPDLDASFSFTKLGAKLGLPGTVRRGR